MERKQTGNFEPIEGRCNSPLRKQPGKYCMKTAGWGTVHTGRGRCKLHGGVQKDPETGEIIDGRIARGGGRYSKLIATRRFQSWLEDFQSKPDPTDLLEELALTRAKLAEILENEAQDRLDLRAWAEYRSSKLEPAIKKVVRASDGAELKEALLELSEAYKNRPHQPIQINNPTAFVRPINTIATLIEQMTKREERFKVPVSAVVQLQTDMARSLVNISGKYMSPAEVKRFITEVTDAWRLIEVQSSS